MPTTTLPTVSKKKKIEIKSFEKLANKVKKYFEEENKYLEDKDKNDDDRSSRKILLGY